MVESVNTSTPMKLWQRGHRGSAASGTKTQKQKPGLSRIKNIFLGEWQMLRMRPLWMVSISGKVQG